jgi:dephospho-CoA kinase
VKTYGLTGGIASGKSAVATLLRRAGIDVVDADALAREVVEKGSEGLAEIREVFGQGMLQEDGSLNRPALGARVFGDPAARKKLEAITHPRIAALAAQRLADLAEKGRPVAVYEVPLLFENNLDGLMAGTLLVACSPEVQEARIVKRDGLSQQEARARISAQMPLEEKRARATVVLENEGSLAELEAALPQAWLELTGLSLNL